MRRLAALLGASALLHRGAAAAHFRCLSEQATDCSSLSDLYESTQGGGGWDPNKNADWVLAASGVSTVNVCLGLSGVTCTTGSLPNCTALAGGSTSPLCKGSARVNSLNVHGFRLAGPCRVHAIFFV